MGKNTAVCMGWRVFSTALVAVACAVTAAPASAVGGQVWYVSSTGSGSKCTEEVPCALSIAVVEAGAGDEVLLLPGQYDLPKFSGLIIDKEISFGGAVGEPVTLETAEGSNLQVVEKAQATLHDLRIEGEGTLKLESGTAERIFVAHFGVHNDACELNKGTTLRNSVCWTLEDNEEDVGVSNALGITASGENQDKPVVLRGVTAIADTKTGNAIHLFSAASAHLNIDAANVIARSVNGTDIVAEIDPKSEFSRTHLNIANSDFGEAESHAPETEVTPIGTNGNISGAPSFLDLAHGDFHVGGESPTLDGGISDSSVGSVDLEGHNAPRRGASAPCRSRTWAPSSGPRRRPARRHRRRHRSRWNRESRSSESSACCSTRRPAAAGCWSKSRAPASSR